MDLLLGILTIHYKGRAWVQTWGSDELDGFLQDLQYVLFKFTTLGMNIISVFIWLLLTALLFQKYHFVVAELRQMSPPPPPTQPIFFDMSRMRRCVPRLFPVI